MSKEYLEALITFDYIMTRCKDEDSYIIKFPLGIGVGTTFGEDMEKAYKVIKEALQRLEAIDDANPSEALNDLEQLAEMADKCWVSCDVHKWKNTIKQALIKSQEQEKALSIIKEKPIESGIAINNIKKQRDYSQYKKTIFELSQAYLLTEEEFELLKRYFEKNIQK